MEVYALIAGIILCVLGIFMKLGWLNILISRYEWFQKAIRKKKFTANKKGVANFYMILFLASGITLLIGSIIGFLNPELFKSFSIWLYLTLALIGIVGIAYCNISKRFIEYE